MGGAWLVAGAVVCLTLAPTLGQITFSRSWVPQGKRSGGGVSGSGSSSPSSSTDLTPDVYREVRLATLNQVAATLAEMMEETVSDLSNDDPSLRLKQAILARRRRMS
ncbi:hypothetical protein Pmani_012968 [Petrolisthes manimaculis]|uniref:Uncharacterized protein n=1 Tax=Petrolisthes manimaculis TaxID=1843537 RepID=A0AAE1PW64_9EUCA|nr:hypothetical protein Pmani_012968 [Petrolisthes manimaculis]